MCGSKSATTRPSGPILIVDDEPEICEIIAEVLADKGIESRSAMDKTTILTCIQRDWACAIIDLTMPDIDGIEVMRCLANANSGMPVILMSGFSISMLEVARKLAECNGIKIIRTLPKPLDFIALGAAIDEAISHCGRLREFSENQETSTAKEPPFRFEAPISDPFRSGISMGGIVPYYQPKIDTDNGRVTGYEAFARWWHPTRGILGPSQFLSQATDDGHLDTVTMAMVEKIAADMDQWSRGGLRIPVSVNVDASTLDNFSMLLRIEQAWRIRDIDPSSVTIKIVGASRLLEPGNVMDNLLRLRELGFGVAVDDHRACEWASKSLGHPPFTQLKIDRTITRNMQTDAPAKEIIRATVDAARAYGMDVVAGGVETEEQAGLLREFGCSHLQGFHYSKPMNAGDVDIWLKANPIAASAVATARHAGIGGTLQ